MSKWTGTLTVDGAPHAKQCGGNSLSKVQITFEDAGVGTVTIKYKGDAGASWITPNADSITPGTAAILEGNITDIQIDGGTSGTILLQEMS